MANPNRPGNTGVTGGMIEPPPVPPIDPEQMRQTLLLAEAVLVSFTANPSALLPFGHATLAWNITMPKTVIPGVHVEVHLSGMGDLVVEPKGSRRVDPHNGTLFALTLRTPLASRHLGTLDLAVNFGTCTVRPGFLDLFEVIIRGATNQAFPAGGQLTLRGNGARIDIGFNSFGVDLPLTADVPNWFDPDVDVSLNFSVFSRNGQIHVIHGVSITTVSIGAASAILSGGCAAFVAAAVEGVTDGLLNGFIGPELASRLESAIKDDVERNLRELNANVPAARQYKFYELTLSVEGLNYRFCPANPVTSPLTSGIRPPTRGQSTRR